MGEKGDQKRIRMETTIKTNNNMDIGDLKSDVSKKTIGR